MAGDIRVLPVEIDSEEKAKKLMSSLGVSKEGIKILSPKSIYLGLQITGIRSWEANIIKQHLLSLGSDAAIERKALLKDINTGIFIFGSLSQLRKLSKKLQDQPFALKEVSAKINLYLNNFQKKEFVFKAGNKTLKINKPIVCGIVNLTTDSFSGDGLLKAGASSSLQLKELALKQCEDMLKKGAKIIDFGAESSRPFSKEITAKAEIKRLEPVLKSIRKEFKKIIISVDTYKYPVAKAAADIGADVINDITALNSDPRMVKLLKKYKLGCVLMHMKGSPRTMQLKPTYKDVIAELIGFFEERLNYCLTQGIDSRSIFIDPGVGFGKRLEDNLAIISNLNSFKLLGMPLFLGLSRKSFIGKILNVGVEQRLIGSSVAAAIALTKGVNVLRVHDVEETIQTIKVVTRINRN